MRRLLSASCLVAALAVNSFAGIIYPDLVPCDPAVQTCCDPAKSVCQNGQSNQSVESVESVEIDPFVFTVFVIDGLIGCR
jgi:hypothetical protein